MKTSEKSIIKKNYYWLLIGPTLLLASLYLIFLQPTSYSPWMPFLSIFGVIVSARWKTNGFIAVLVILLVISALFIPTIDLDDRFWYFGMNVTIALSCLITALTFQEIESSTEIFSVKSTAYENPVNIELTKKIEDLSAEIAVMVATKENLDQLLLASREEYFFNQEQMRGVQQSLMETKRELSNREEDIEAYTTSFKVLQTEITEYNKEKRKLNIQIANQKNQHEQLEKKWIEEKNHWEESSKITEKEFQVIIQANKADISRLESSLIGIKKEKEDIEKELSLMRKKYDEKEEMFLKENHILAKQTDHIKITHENNLKTIFAEKEKLKEEIEKKSQSFTRREQELNQIISTDKEEIAFLEESLRTLKADKLKKEDKTENSQEFEVLYKQLKQQFAEKSEQLRFTRKALFLAEEKQAELEMNLENLNKYDFDSSQKILIDNLQKAMKAYTKEISTYKEEIAKLESIISSLLQKK